MAAIRAFVVRPFGTKEGIDFDKVDRDLVQPALAKLRRDHDIQVSGGTTVEIVRQGNIRTDMFQRLITAELVIADVSIHNANVFYELGVRHGLQSRWTFLIRSEVPRHDYPFDLQTDRYFLYEANDPGKRVDAMVEALRSTLANQAKDSPVFLLLPKLKPHDRSELITVPQDFREDVERRKKAQQRGDLRLLAHEVQDLEWQTEGLRLVGEAQFKLKAYPGARETFEALRRFAPDDLNANQRLGTIYQRLARNAPGDRREDLLARSDHAIRRALQASTLPKDRAEAHSLLGSNAKARWIDHCAQVEPSQRPTRALRSPHLAEALDAYLQAFRENLDAHYPAVNALGLLLAQARLARELPDVWQEKFDDERGAAIASSDREQAGTRIAALLQLALAMDDVVGKPVSMDEWAISSKADLLLLTQPNKPQRVAEAYRQALANAEHFNIEATRRNVEIFRDLALFEPGASAAIAAIDEALAASQPPPPPRARVVLFTGHMVDPPTRAKDKLRFPPTAKAEATARRLIRQALEEEAQQEGGISLGIAGGACGSDILFHEACLAMGIKSELYLALPENRFLTASVERGGPGWVERYRRLCGQLATRELQESEALPDWLVDKAGYDVWQRNNLWMMFNALATDARNLTLIALYNPDREPDGPGGTAHLVDTARQWGFKSIPLDGRALLAE